MVNAVQVSTPLKPFLPDDPVDLAAVAETTVEVADNEQEEQLFYGK